MEILCTGISCLLLANSEGRLIVIEDDRMMVGE